MFRFLVVEDVRSTREQLVKLIEESFDGCHVSSAETVAQALSFLKSAADTHYDIAILDFRLPKDVGYNLEIDTSICSVVKQKMPDALVVHISGHMEDQLVAEHILSAHNEPEARQFLVSKSSAFWGRELIAGIERYLYSKRVNAKMDELFGIENHPYRSERRLRKHGHLTHQLAELKLDLEAFWQKLEPRLRARVEWHFNHAPTDEGEQFTLRLPGNGVS